MKHLAIIADGNRRWAHSNGLPPRFGYAQGLTTIENCCDWAISNGVQYLTVYCFSTENWSRSENEVDMIMDLARWYCVERRDWYISMGIRIRFIGRRDRLAKDIVEKFYSLEEDTKDGNAMTLQICADYGGRDEIVRAISAGAKTEDDISAFLSNNVPDPDAILRTGGEQRLSNFLLWQCAYAELFFSQTLFPSLTYQELDIILDEFGKRKRNYGK